MEAFNQKKEFWGKQRIFDIAANMSDDRFFGKYYGKQAHKSDFDQCMQRARDFGVSHYLFAAGYIEDAKISMDLCEKT